MRTTIEISNKNLIQISSNGIVFERKYAIDWRIAFEHIQHYILCGAAKEQLWSHCQNTNTPPVHRKFKSIKSKYSRYSFNVYHRNHNKCSCIHDMKRFDWMKSAPFSRFYFILVRFCQRPCSFFPQKKKKKKRHTHSYT